MIKAQAHLIESARAGDQTALKQLLAVCQPDLERFARRTCSTTEDVEDAVQVALWQLYQRIGALRTVATFAVWLFRIVERECFRLLIGRKDALALEDIAAQDMPRAPELPLDLQRDLVNALQRLTPPYREVLLLRDVHELTAPEVAAQLGLSLEAVKSRLHRARTMVRNDLWSSGYWQKDDPATTK